MSFSRIIRRSRLFPKPFTALILRLNPPPPPGAPPPNACGRGLTDRDSVSAEEPHVRVCLQSSLPAGTFGDGFRIRQRLRGVTDSFSVPVSVVQPVQILLASKQCVGLLAETRCQI